MLELIQIGSMFRRPDATELRFFLNIYGIRDLVGLENVLAFFSQQKTWRFINEKSW